MATRLMPSANNASACGSICVTTGRPIFCDSRSPHWRSKSRPLSRMGGVPLTTTMLQPDGLQVTSDLLDPLERIFEGLPIAAAKTHEGRHDFYSLRCPVVPEMKAFAPMSRFDQSDARAPPKHVTFPPSYSSN